jgi:hypothetical protein
MNAFEDKKKLEHRSVKQYLQRGERTSKEE